MKRATQLLIIIATLGLLIGNGTPVMAQVPVNASINAPPQVLVDSDFTATLDVTSLTDFDAGQFDISFDDSVLRLDNITTGLIGDVDIPVSSWNEISPGIYRTIVNVPGIPAVTGSGYLVVLHFHVIGPEGSSSDIALSNEFLNDNLTREIAATWVGDSLTVYEQHIYQPDVNGDEAINILDMIKVGQHLDETGPSGWIPEDINKDGTVNELDINLIDQNWTV